MNHLRKTLAVGAIAVGIVLLTGTSAFAATSDTSTTTGSYATCSIAADGNGQKVTCNLYDTAQDGNSVRIEWSGPGKSGKDNLTSGNGTSANYVYTFASRGDFSFKSVTDRGILPDHVGPTKTIRL